MYTTYAKACGPPIPSAVGQQVAGQVAVLVEGDQGGAAATDDDLGDGRVDDDGGDAQVRRGRAQQLGDHDRDRAAGGDHHRGAVNDGVQPREHTSAEPRPRLV